MLLLCVFVYMCKYVCACVGVCRHEALVENLPGSHSPPSCSLSQALPELTKMTNLSHLLALEMPYLHLLSTGITSRPLHYLGLMWALGTRTPILTFAWQMLYPLSRLRSTSVCHFNR